MDKPRDKQTDSRRIAVKSAELELDFLARRQAALVEQLRRLQQPHPPGEARRRP